MFRMFREYPDTFEGGETIYKRLDTAVGLAITASRRHAGDIVIVSMSANYRIVARYHAGERVEFSAEVEA